ncbi:undecaprenyl-diphosphate phosphatase [Ornithinibacillus halotolerans]|uniref:Undecaprenyl-diphosphatase n=1 Tax=Ornithinibacillus halotolerans TaxID=1274357 RepID=A0A916W7D9_9BACI|nr:undecaprenyl-diphosphate phosphatase [Ornithinibacillus halotolerans]GGA73902.1 undecaprenyl-diphosphatase 1 [Ornithinibacillus halotolerans]
MESELLTLLKYIFLGLLQGFTEPIPISSSGHIVLAREILGIKAEGLSFEALVNFGSLIAVIIIYFNDIVRLGKNGFNYVFKKDEAAKGDFIFIILLLIATFITGIIGIILEERISSLSTTTVVGITLLITGIALWIIRNLRGRKSDKQVTLKDAIIVGLAQTVALIPGISRSGATIVAAMLLGMKQETALRFSFLLYIPVSLGVGLLSIDEIVNDEYFDTLWIPYLLAFLSSIIATYFALKWFMNIMARGNLKYFAFYCFVVGVLVVLFL